MIDVDSVALDMPPGDDNPNRVPWRGILTQVDQPSTRPPNGSHGHRVLIPRAVAETALPSLLGMPVNVAGDQRDHEKPAITGVITSAMIEGNDVVVAGHLFGKNVPDKVSTIQDNKHRLGMSYEIGDVVVEDDTASIWTLLSFIFTGAAILEKTAAAYSHTAIAASVEEETLMPGEATAIMDELKKLGRQIEAARKDEEDDEDDEAARKDEDDAKRKDEEARKAREDDDEDAAKKHDEDATRLRLAAAKKHEDAAKKYEDEAKKHEEDEDAKGISLAAAKRHADAAKRVKDEEEAAKKRREDEDEEDAARHRDEDEDANGMMPAVFAMLLKSMGYGKGRKADAAAKQDDADDDDMARMLGRMLLKGMAYPGVAPRARRKADAAHDDEAEDIALFKRLMQRSPKMDAGTSRDDLDTRRLRREQRDMRAAMELITDTLKKQTGLITDMQHSLKNLATDKLRPGQGGPARRTLAATGTFVSKWDTAEPGGKDEVSLDQLNAALDKGGLQVSEATNQQRIAKKLEAQMTGVLKTD